MKNISGSFVTAKGDGNRYSVIIPGTIRHYISESKGYAGGISYMDPKTNTNMGSIGARWDANRNPVYYYMGGNFDSPIFKVEPNGTCTAAAFKGNLTGNAGSADKLKTAMELLILVLSERFSSKEQKCPQRILIIWKTE